MLASGRRGSSDPRGRRETARGAIFADVLLERNNERAGRLGKCAKSEGDEDECRAAAREGVARELRDWR
jgi:hypothetical protein